MEGSLPEHRPAEPAGQTRIHGNQSDGNQVSSCSAPHGIANTTGQSCLNPRKSEETKFDPGLRDLVDREDTLPGRNKVSQERRENMEGEKEGQRRPGRW